MAARSSLNKRYSSWCNKPGQPRSELRALAARIVFDDVLVRAVQLADCFPLRAGCWLPAARIKVANDRQSLDLGPERDHKRRHGGRAISLLVLGHVCLPLPLFKPMIQVLQNLK